MTESDDDRRGAIRGYREWREKAEVGRLGADPAESHPINPDSGPGHYAEAIADIN
jgi:hypothetical protein